MTIKTTARAEQCKNRRGDGKNMPCTPHAMNLKLMLQWIFKVSKMMKSTIYILWQNSWFSVLKHNSECFRASISELSLLADSRRPARCSHEDLGNVCDQAGEDIEEHCDIGWSRTGAGLDHVLIRVNKIAKGKKFTIKAVIRLHY